MRHIVISWALSKSLPKPKWLLNNNVNMYSWLGPRFHTVSGPNLICYAFPFLKMQSKV